MRTFVIVLVAILLFWIAFSARGDMILPIVEVYDGDTIKTQLTLPAPLNEMSIRINGIDTPEMPAKSYATTGKLGRADCVLEAELALLAKARIQYLAHGTNTMLVTNYEWGKFGGRVLGDVSINGVDVAELLIEEGLAIPYHGKKKTHNWCE